uniref:Putative ovule protein n=1 Tax=Solanum chacoense TaxID=4108 RepID=A0A0V0HJU5_SOLCH
MLLAEKKKSRMIMGRSKCPVKFDLNDLMFCCHYYQLITSYSISFPFTNLVNKFYIYQSTFL